MGKILTIGLLGATGAGKDHSAIELNKVFRMMGYISRTYSHANKLKDTVCDRYNLNREQLEKLKRSHEMVFNNKNVRDILIETAHEFTKENTRYFTDYIYNEINEDPADISIITDPRRLVEINAVIQRDGTFIIIENDNTGDEQSTQLEDLTFIKKYLSSYPRVIYLNNNGKRLKPIDFSNTAETLLHV